MIKTILDKEEFINSEYKDVYEAAERCQNAVKGSKDYFFFLSSHTTGRYEEIIAYLKLHLGGYGLKTYRWKTDGIIRLKHCGFFLPQGGIIRDPQKTIKNLLKKAERVSLILVKHQKTPPRKTGYESYHVSPTRPAILGALHTYLLIG